MDTGQSDRDRDVIDRWQKAEGADLGGEAERARQKLMVVDGAKPTGRAEGDADDA